MVCVEGAGIGEACSGLYRCFDFGTYCKAGTCAALEVDGAACMDDNDCAGDYCDPATNVCATEGLCF